MSLIRKNFRDYGVILLLLLLAACAGGAADGSGGVGALDGAGSTLGGNGNYTQGTLGSQSDIQEMADGCFSPYSLRFSGEAAGQLKNWFQLQPEQKNFSTPGLIFKTNKETNGNEEICSNCGGRIVRVIDFGNPGLNPFQRDMGLAMFWTGIRKHFLKAEIFAQTRYQDFVVGSVGEVSFQDLPIAVGHVYLFLLSAKPMEPVTASTAFASMEEFYAVTACSDKPEQHPFVWARAFEARNNEPSSGFPKPIPQGEGTVDNDLLKLPVDPEVFQPVDDPNPEPNWDLNTHRNKINFIDGAN